MRVVSLLASGTEIVCALGAGKWLVGRSHECDSPSWVATLPACTRPAFDISMTSGQIDAEVRRRLKAGEPLYHVDTELIDSLNPDLLITQEHCKVCAVTPADLAQAECVSARHLLALEAGSVQGILRDIRSIGRALGRREHAEQLVTQIGDRIERIRCAVAPERAPSLVALEWTDPVFAMGNWGPELVAAANARLLPDPQAGFSAVIDWQRVRELDPDWLVIAPCGFELGRTTGEVPTLEALAGWFELRAVRQGNVALADGNRYFNRSGPTIVETLEILAEILHGYPAGHEGAAWIRYSSLTTRQRSLSHLRAVR
jgi:iron complex transport system substrate-binding protein